MKLEHVINKKRMVKMLLSVLLDSNFTAQEKEDLILLIHFLMDE